VVFWTAAFRYAVSKDLTRIRRSFTVDHSPIADAGDQLLNESWRVSTETSGGCEMLMNAQGWSSASMAYVRGDAVRYLVSCNRGNDWLLAHGDTEHQAWKDVIKQSESSR
jgi:hypothetical protein